MPSGSNDADASNAQVSPVQVTVNEAMGRASARVKVRPRVASLCPSPSVTIRIAAYVLPPEYEYVCAGAGPEPVVPSPNSTRKLTIAPSGSNDPAALNWHVLPAQAVVNAAAGCPGSGTNHAGLVP